MERYLSTQNKQIENDEVTVLTSCFAIGKLFRLTDLYPCGTELREGDS